MHNKVIQTPQPYKVSKPLAALVLAAGLSLGLTQPLTAENAVIQPNSPSVSTATNNTSALSTFLNTAPSIALLLIGLAVVLNSILKKRNLEQFKTKKPEQQVEQIIRWIKEDKSTALSSYFKNNQTAIGRVAQEALSVLKEAKDIDREEFEERLHDFYRTRIEKEMNRNIHSLKFMTDISPLIGMLGTVTSILVLGINSEVSLIDQLKENPALLISSLAGALGSTAIGIVVSLWGKSFLSNFDNVINTTDEDIDLLISDLKWKIANDPEIMRRINSGN